MDPGTGAAPAIELATTTPAGDITMPDTTMQMGAGMRMASSVPCAATPTEAEQRAAVTLVDTSWQDAKKYQSLAAAKAAGDVPITPMGGPVVHYMDKAANRATLLGGPVLDLTEPQSLVKHTSPHIYGPPGSGPGSYGISKIVDQCARYSVHTDPLSRQAPRPARPQPLANRRAAELASNIGTHCRVTGWVSG